MNAVEQHLLSQSELDPQQLQQILQRIYQHQVDFADLYFQASRHETWMLEDGVVKEGSYNIERGVGVRAIAGEKTGFAYSDDISSAALLKAADAARGIVSAEQQGKVQVFAPINSPKHFLAVDPLAS